MITDSALMSVFICSGLRRQKTATDQLFPDGNRSESHTLSGSTAWKEVFHSMERKKVRMMKRTIISVAFAAGLVLGGQAFAHSPLCACYDNGDGTITCEGGFSDGAVAAEMKARVEDPTGKIILKGTMDAIGEFTFKKPEGPFLFVFDAGPGHVVKIKAKDIQ